MKILYGIQGTGNGHLSRAVEMVPAFKKKAEVDILISGVQSDIRLPYPVKYQLQGFSYFFGKKGGIDFRKTIGEMNLGQLIRDIRDIPISKYDLVISDFEPVTAWASLLTRTRSIGLSHQNALLMQGTDKPGGIYWGMKWIIKYYAPSRIKYGFDFQSRGNNTFTPIVRKSIRQSKIENLGHYTVYLPAFDDSTLIKVLSKVHVPWQVFSKHGKEKRNYKNILIQPIDSQEFVKSLVSCEGILCGAGFETPSEALFLGKKLMVIPMKDQYEQYCNAASLHTMKVPVMKSLKLKHLEYLKQWVVNGKPVRIDYPDITADIVEKILSESVN